MDFCPGPMSLISSLNDNIIASFPAHSIIYGALDSLEVSYSRRIRSNVFVMTKILDLVGLCKAMIAPSGEAATKENGPSVKP